MERRNTILVDCKVEEVIDVLEGLKSITEINWSVESCISNWGRTSKVSEIKRYLMYFKFPLEIFIHRKEYETIVGWQQFYALIFSFFCAIFRVKKTTMVCAVNFTYKEKKGVVGVVYKKFMRFILNSKYLDYICVLSQDYARLCVEQLGISYSKIIVLPFGVPDLYEKYKNEVLDKEFTLAIGRSNRDYNWLINEWNDVNYPLYIISDTYKPTSDIPSNVKIFSNISGEDQFPYIMNCRLMILPIEDERICSGDTVLLTALSFKKTVIVNELTTLAEMYVDNGNNALLVSKQAGKLSKLINKVLNENIDLGEEARKSYIEKFSRLNMGKTIGKYLR